MKLERMVVAVDFMEPGLEAARWAAIHFAPDSALRLVHVIHVPTPPFFLRGLYPSPDELVEMAEEGARTRLEELARDLRRARRGSVDTDVRSGQPHEEIEAAAREHAADLIVVGHHAPRGGVWEVLGTTAERLIHGSGVPVLLVDHLPGGSPDQILAPIDGGELDARILEAARELAGRFGATVTALHVLPMPLHEHVRVVSSAEKADEVDRDARRGAQGWLAERLEEAGFAEGSVEALVALGDPAFEIVVTATRHASTLIIMGTRGEGLLARSLFGSVANGVFRSAPCPVLTISAWAA
ncbi:MAG: universal stress protein [Gemmatimonadetes bacterium]|nr:universal stress protein [Gemmatimonadota bacterium]